MFTTRNIAPDKNARRLQQQSQPSRLAAAQPAAASIMAGSRHQLANISPESPSSSASSSPHAPFGGRNTRGKAAAAPAETDWDEAMSDDEGEAEAASPAIAYAASRSRFASRNPDTAAAANSGGTTKESKRKLDTDGEEKEDEEDEEAATHLSSSDCDDDDEEDEAIKAATKNASSKQPQKKQRISVSDNAAASSSMPSLHSQRAALTAASAATPMASSQLSVNNDVDEDDPTLVATPKRKRSKRAAKAVTTAPKVKHLRSDRDRDLQRKQLEAQRVDEKHARVARKASRPLQALPEPRTVAAYAAYPEGSYGHGRYLYLNRELQGLGGVPKNNGLIDVSHAEVEVDHAPHDASQRRGERKDDEASRYRVAVPLPYAWHRRHKTTHGGQFQRFDHDFSQQQVNLVRGGNYAGALQNHLSDTFHPEAVGNIGHKKITLVAAHTLKALDYAASNRIAHSIHAGHTAGTPAITMQDHTKIKQHLQTRFEELKAAKGMKELNNPFA